jgi:hypothetical protein
MGCAGVSGFQAKFKLLLDGNLGILEDMGKLSMQFISLPAARLKPKFAFKQNQKWQVDTGKFICQHGCNLGGGLVATNRTELGSNRRLWVGMRVAGGKVMHICTVYFPADAGIQSEANRAAVHFLLAVAPAETGQRPLAQHMTARRPSACRRLGEGPRPTKYALQHVFVSLSPDPATLQGNVD